VRIFLTAFLSLTFLGASHAQDVGRPPLEISGKVELDAVFFNPQPGFVTSYGDLKDERETRRLRLSFSSENDSAHFRSTVDFRSKGFKDFYIDRKEWSGPGHLRFGHFREPFSFEALTPSDNILFLERSLTTDFSPGRNLGVMAWDYEKHASRSWALGAFWATSEPSLDFENGGETAKAITGRMHWHYEGDFDFMPMSFSNVQASSGLSASLRFPEENFYSLNIGGEVSTFPTLLATGPIQAKSVQQLSLEAAATTQTLTALAEVSTTVDRGGIEDHNFLSGSAQLGWVFRGGSRSIIPGRVAFDAPRFRRELTGVPSIWELSIRSSWADLNSGNIQAGTGKVNSLALNVHMKPNHILRIESNRIQVNGVGNSSAFQVRLHWSF
jgi:phosphate-selective porin